MDLDKYLTMCPFFSQLNQYRLRILTSDYHQRLSEQGDTLRWSHSNTKSFVPQSFPIAQKTTLWWQNENSTKSKDCNGCQWNIPSLETDLQRASAEQGFFLEIRTFNLKTLMENAPKSTKNYDTFDFGRFLKVRWGHFFYTTWDCFWPR